MIIRSASVADRGEIASIWNREIREGVATFNSEEKSEDEIGDLIRQLGSAFLVAEMDESVIGFAMFSTFRSGVGYARCKEQAIYLAPGHQGLGIGPKLLEALFQVAKNQNVHSLIAAVGGENQAGVRFHNAMGFEKVAHVPRVGYKFDRWMDLILMQKFL